MKTAILLVSTGAALIFAGIALDAFLGLALGAPA
jgi:hypothetical protein